MLCQVLMKPADAEYIFNGVPAILSLHKDITASLGNAWDAFPDVFIGKVRALDLPSSNS